MVDWKQLYAQRALEMTDTALRDMLTLTQKADIISFSGGLPAPELFPVERFRQAADLVLTVYGQRALQYSPTEGHTPLRRWVASQLNRHGMRVDESNVLITTGSQQASELIGRLLIDQGDPVLVESPTYVGALQAFGIYKPCYIVVPTDEDGLRVDALEPYFQAKPKLLYLLPNFQNPSGTTLSKARRDRLVQLSTDHGVPIVEDDPYSLLRYEGESLPPLIALDARRAGVERPGVPGNVLYHGTFSKLLAPGLRIGWVIAAAEVIQQLAVLKQGVDLHTGTFDQMIAYEVARSGFLDNHVERLTKIYRHRRDVMLEAMIAYFPDVVQWTRPRGGLFIFVTLPQSVNARDLLVKSLEQRVAFVPGNAFFPDGKGHNTLRLNFSNAKPDRIVEGIKRLGKVIDTFCKS